MTAATLLVELLTEELPPKSLARLAEALHKALTEDLQQDGFITAGSESRAYATPRRLAVLITQVLAQSPDKALEIQGPSLKVGLDKDGKPTPALAGFAKKNGVALADLVQVESAKGTVFACRKTVAGSPLQTTLAAKVEAALKKLPIAKVMRWGDGDAEFVRPVHGLVMLHGAAVVTGTVLGIASGNKTRGHRFMGQAELVIADAESYAGTLEKEGMVVADFARRRAMIDELLQAEAKKQQATLGEYQDLLDEVTALVEHPSVYVGAFDKGFLEVPAECLILTMRQNQKYFPLFDNAGKLGNKFLIVSNMQVADPSHIISGNQRVVRPRLEDARFFYNQDRKERLEARISQLGKVVYHNKLGTQLERVERVAQLASTIARALGADHVAAGRAARLAKADLITGMVGEFPELQGVMGRYYALHDGEPVAIADAIAQHYQPRFAGDRLPERKISCAVALADKLETLAGLFGIGQLPTGDRDPYALRRHALGVIRILIERDLPLSVVALINDAFEVFPKELKLGDARNELATFIFERMRGYFSETGYTSQEIDAVLSMRPAIIHQIPLQLAAVRAFAALPEAASLAAANKRIKNIIGKSAPSAGDVFSEKHFQASEEIELYKAFTSADTKADSAYAAGQFTETLQALAVLRPAVDAFFDKVMVNVEDPALRSNRLLLLMKLESAFNRFADISKLAA